MLTMSYYCSGDNTLQYMQGLDEGSKLSDFNQYSHLNLTVIYSVFYSLKAKLRRGEERRGSFG